MAQEKKLPAPTQFQWIKSEKGIIEIYGNMIHPTWTLYDVRLVIGQLMAHRGDPVGKGFVVEEQGGLTISWAQAKALRDILSSLIDSYEKVNGEIKQPNLARPRESVSAGDQS